MSSKEEYLGTNTHCLPPSTAKHCVSNVFFFGPLAHLGVHIKEEVLKTVKIRPH